MGSDQSTLKEPQTKIRKVTNNYQDQGRRKFDASLMFIQPKTFDQEGIQEGVLEEITQDNLWETQISQVSEHQEQPIDDYQIEYKYFEDCLKWNQFVKLKNENFKDSYIPHNILGKGAFGEVLLVQNKYTGIYSAAKKINKNQMPRSKKQKLFVQMSILSQLDHPSIIKLLEVYEHMDRYIMIFEYLQGGMDLEMYTRILPGNIWKEQDLVGIMKQVFRSLIYLREKKVIHRDIKCQNFLIQPKSKVIKLIDFGVALKYQENSQAFTATTGTPKYMAPEVYQKKYSYEIDVWSCGVMLYRLICGYFPSFKKEDFSKKDNKDNLCFHNKQIWNKVSEECIDLVKKMLQKNPFRRIPIEKCLSHPWMQKAVSSRDIAENKSIYNRLSKFKFMNSLQAVVNTYIVSQLTKTHERSQLLNAFKDMDKNNDGIISYPELFQILEDIVSKKMKIDNHGNITAAQKNRIFQETQKLMKILDLNKSGFIDYTEFLVGAIKQEEYVNEENLQKAFHFFDIDHSGGITIQQFSVFLQGKSQNTEQIRELFNLVDANNDGYISKQEFVALLMRMMKNCELIYSQAQQSNKNTSQYGEDLIIEASRENLKKKENIRSHKKRISLAEAIRSQMELQSIQSIKENVDSYQNCPLFTNRTNCKKLSKARNSSFGP